MLRLQTMDIFLDRPAIPHSCTFRGDDEPLSQGAMAPKLYKDQENEYSRFVGHKNDVKAIVEVVFGCWGDLVLMGISKK